MQLPVVTQEDFFLTFDPSWTQLQLNNIIVPVDVSLNSVVIHLPLISPASNPTSIANQPDFTITVVAVGGNFLVENIVIVPAATNFIAGGTLVQITNANQSAVIKQNGGNNWLCTISQPPIFLAVGSLSVPDIGDHASSPIGTEIAVVDWNSTGEGCTIMRTTAAFGGTAQDWVVVATTSVAATGNIGLNPI